MIDLFFEQPSRLLFELDYFHRFGRNSFCMQMQALHKLLTLLFFANYYCSCYNWHEQERCYFWEVFGLEKKGLEMEFFA